MYKQFFGCIFILACSSKAFSACKTDVNPVNFTANMEKSLSDNSYLQLSSQTVVATSPQPISGCNGIGGGPSRFTMASNTDLLTSSTISKDGYTYYQIPTSYITPTPTFNVYVAFSVKDNQNSAIEYWVNDATTAYTIYTGTSDTRGIRLQNVRLLVSGIGNTQGIFSINNPRLGSLIATSGSQTANTVIRLSNSTFRITKTTCVVNNGTAINVKLPTVLATDFTSVGQTLGDTIFTVNVSGCNASDANKSLIALLTDNNNPTASSSLGLLKNTGVNYSPNVSVQITDSNSVPLQIAPKLINSSNSFFNFGTIGTGGAVSKSFKARYYSNTIPVPPTDVYAQATITLIYN